MADLITRSRAVVGLGLVLLGGCDWGHLVQFQVRPSPADQTFSAAVAAAAQKASLAKLDRRTQCDCPLGAFVEADSPTPAQAIWLCAGRSGDRSVADLREFNRGAPWRPDAKFLKVQNAIGTHLREQFGDRVDIVTEPEKRLKIEPRIMP